MRTRVAFGEIVLASILASASSSVIACDASEMKIHMGWSMRDTGAVEKNIQAEWARIDAAYKDGPKLASCGARGRACAMEIAVEAAVKKFDQKAFDIAASTQAHPSGCRIGIAGNTPTQVADYLRGCAPNLKVCQAVGK